MCPGTCVHTCVQVTYVPFPYMEGRPWTPTLDTEFWRENCRCPERPWTQTWTQVTFVGKWNRPKNTSLSLFTISWFGTPWTQSGHMPGHRDFRHVSRELYLFPLISTKTLDKEPGHRQSSGGKVGVQVLCPLCLSRDMCPGSLSREDPKKPS